MSGLSPERREELAAALYSLTWTSALTDADPELRESYLDRADDLAPLIAGWLAEERAARLDYSLVSGYDLGRSDGAAEFRARVEVPLVRAIERAEQGYRNAAQDGIDEIARVCAEEA